jgi:uncharacterized membrane protein
MPLPSRSHWPVTSPLVALAFHVLAVIALGVMAGFFGAYSVNVNLATSQMDGATYAQVQSAFNRHVRHGLFFAFFFSPPLLCLLAALAAWSQPTQQTPSLPWCLMAIGAVYGLGIVVFTAQLVLPLNYTTESWNPAALPADWADVRSQWSNSNLLRAWVSLGCFAVATGLLAWRGARR